MLRPCETNSRVFELMMKMVEKVVCEKALVKSFKKSPTTFDKLPMNKTRHIHTTMRDIFFRASNSLSAFDKRKVTAALAGGVA